jgi:LPS-assembly lipoprotein
MWWSDPGRRAALRALAALAVAPGLGLAGCGFELRRPPRMAFGRIALTGFAARSPLAEEFKRELLQQVQVVDTPDRAEVVLQALDDVRERSVVASTSAAQVRELQLRLKFNFRAHTPAGRELIPRAELLLTRDLSYSETFALSKEQEEAELFREMQDDVVAQVLRRLAAVRV